MPGLCDASDRRNTITMLLFFGTAVPVSLYVVTEGGMASLSSGLLSGVVAGVVVGGLYFGSQCGFSVGKCLGSGVASAGCGVWSDLKGLVGAN